MAVTKETQERHNRLLAEAIAYIQARGLVFPQARIVMVRDPADELVGRIIVPEEAKHKPSKGTVIALGKGMQDPEIGDHGIEVGQHTMYTKYGGVVFKLGLPSGEKIEVEFVHWTDVYVCFPAEE